MTAMLTVPAGGAAAVHPTQRQIVSAPGTASVESQRPVGHGSFGSGGGAWPAWLAPAFVDFHRGQRPLKVLAQWKAAVAAAAAVGSANLIFLMARTPTHQEVWFILSLSCLALALIQLPFAHWAERRARLRQKRRAQAFYGLGLWIDGHGRLVVNRANGAVVLTPADALARSSAGNDQPFAERHWGWADR